MTETRDSWEVYFMKIAHQVATRATCDRAHVGAVIVRNKNILATGYNGSMVGADHCDGSEGHLMRDNHCIRTVHAEMNAIAQAAKNGVAIAGADLYITHFCCWNCFKLVVNAGIRVIYFDNMYRLDEAIRDMMMQWNCESRLEDIDSKDIKFAAIPLCKTETSKKLVGMPLDSWSVIADCDTVRLIRVKVEEEDQTEALPPTEAVRRDPAESGLS